MTEKAAPTYEGEVLGVLAYEFPFSDAAEAERKIRGRLRRKRLGAYDPRRIAILRAFKDEVQAEVGKAQHSAYYLGGPGPYAEMSHFDLTRLTADLVARHPDVPAAEVASFVPFAVFLYYLR